MTFLIAYFSIAALVFTAAVPEKTSFAGPDATRAPVAPKVPKELSLHGETRVDDYFWLRQKTSPQVIGYLNAENAYTDGVMRPLKPFEDALYREILARIKQTDLDLPDREGRYFYYSRTEQGKQYPIYGRTAGRPDSPEQVLVDGNELAEGRKFFAFGTRAIHPDGNLLAYTTDVTGDREFTLFVKDLRTGRLLPEHIPNVRSVAWATDDKTLFYGTEDDAKRPYRIHRHTLGSDPKHDTIIFEEKDELFRVFVRLSRDRKYVFLQSTSATTSEQHVIPADRPETPPRAILRRQDGHKYVAEHREGTFIIRTNKGEENREYRLVSAPADDPCEANWKEIIPARPRSTIRDVALFKNHGVISGVEAGVPFLEILDFASGGMRSHRLAFSEPAYSILGDANPEYDTSAYRYRYQSLVTPSSVYEYDMEARVTKLLKRTEVLGGYDPANYGSERIVASAADGTEIPIVLVSKKTTPRDGSAPLLLYGYGSYGALTPVIFNPSYLSLLDRGVIYAIAQVRGGGDLGQGWHDEGKMLKKQNTFTDFIACADELVRRKYTRREKLVLRGLSAGGLLIGAVCNSRPDVCKAAVLEVPFVDVINSMSDPSLPLTIQEYLEWGNPNRKVEYDYLKSYSPYDNIRATNYPAMLVRASLNDSQVPYWEPAKYVAKMRARRTDRNLLLLKTNMDAGHRGASGRYDALRETAFLFAFILDQVDIHK